MHRALKHASVGDCCSTAAAVRRVVRVRRVCGECAVVFGALRCVSSTHTVSREELRAALRALSLPDGATDSDIKARFQELAKTSHPDVLHGVNPHSSSGDADPQRGGGGNMDASRNEATAAENMRRGVEAYRLLRRYSSAERRMILSSLRDSDAHQRAQRAYEGRRREQSQEPQGGDSGAQSGRGRNKTAQFNAFRERMERMREEAPPWNLADRQRRGARHALSFMFGSQGHSAKAAMDRIFCEYQRTGGLGDGPAGNTRRPQYPPGTFASTSAAFAPQAEVQYMRSREKAQQAAVIDAAVGSRLVLGVFAFFLLAVACMVYATVSRRRGAQWKYYTTETPATYFISNGVGEEGKEAGGWGQEKRS
ncbi:chaperone protein DNAJ [Trypanosoma rangeli]|uniref:Chaperone protein DNAJ n=1 Tax=Trypanosoma rangeli TaxID=5698 RepID=A0A3R7M567_TRYRA|nr:chaperone protein DNAJ [Trypanosoma rangeli]RNE99624.1 chaperone protein DNAJ [Trypanosoma rangeli]|eukprot:RNE99624.1 chaperone protein DNAJ [Trypanosoma rangeli]